MGKWLYTNLYTIFSQLGNYAFPNGKPQIDWGGGNPPVIPPCTVSKTIGTGLSSTGGDSDVAFGDPLEVSIAITDNLYVVDDNSVVVTMGGSPVQGAWNASTMKVTIAAVTGNVVINVPSLTYVSSDLVFQLDCKNRGGQSGHWIDRIGHIDFALGSGVTESDTGVVFDGTQNAYGTASGSLNQLASAGATIEVVASVDNNNNIPAPFLINPVIEGISARLGSDGGQMLFIFMMGWNNRQLYRRIDPILSNCEISDSDYDDYFDALFSGSGAFVTNLDKMHKHQVPPTKLWCATNDTAVLYSHHEAYCDLVTRCGGVAELRSYTGSDGNHATFCGEGGKVANNLPTPYGGTMSGVNIGIVEAVEWFKRW